MHFCCREVRQSITKMMGTLGVSDILLCSEISGHKIGKHSGRNWLNVTLACTSDTYSDVTATSQNVNVVTAWQLADSDDHQTDHIADRSSRWPLSWLPSSPTSCPTGWPSGWPSSGSFCWLPSWPPSWPANWPRSWREVGLRATDTSPRPPRADGWWCRAVPTSSAWIIRKSRRHDTTRGDADQYELVSELDRRRRPAQDPPVIFQLFYSTPPPTAAVQRPSADSIAWRCAIEMLPHIILYYDNIAWHRNEDIKLSSVYHVFPGHSRSSIDIKRAVWSPFVSSL